MRGPAVRRAPAVAWGLMAGPPPYDDQRPLGACSGSARVLGRRLVRVPARRRLAVVFRERVTAPVALEIAPHGVDVVTARVVELDQELRALDAEVEGLATRERACPAEAQRVQAALAHALQALL